MTTTLKLLKELLEIVFIDEASEKDKWDLAEQLIMSRATELGYCEYHKADNMYYLSKKGINLVEK